MDKSRSIKAGIIGCGAIGRVVAGAVIGRFKNFITLEAVCDVEEDIARNFINDLGITPKILTLDDLVNTCELIIEAASAGVSYEIAEKSLQAGKTIIIMSTGGLLNKPDIFEMAQKTSGKLYLPSGAICGLDGLKAAMMTNVESVTLTTRKPPKGLKGAPYIREKNIDLDNVKDETVVFEGSAVEAVKGFPQNVNVAATLSLAGIGKEKTKVRVITSPDYTSNRHEIEIKGDFGKLVTVMDNVPMPTNPKTSYMAALSAIAVLDGLVANIRIGN